MPDALEVITKVIAEHHKIREHVRLAGEALNDIEAHFTLQQAYSGWTQSSTEALLTKRDQLLQAISALAEGLKTHFAYEEEYLPPLFGELLMKALLVEHHAVGQQIEATKNVLGSTDLKALSQQELLVKKSEVQSAVNRISQAVEEHAGHEEIILNMIQKALEGA